MSKSNLLFTIEQWELVRRLRNSGLTKEQLCQAFDDLERVERDLGNMYNTPNDTPIIQHQTQNSLSNTDPFVLAKHLQLFMAKNLAAISYNQRLNGSLATTTTTPTSTINTCTTTSPTISTNTNNLTINDHLNGSANNNNVNTTSPNASVNHNGSQSTMSPNNDSSNSLNINAFTTDIEEEVREFENFRLKGDAAIHSEISTYVYKYDLKQSQIARMAGVNQAYVSKFLRGDFNDLSENGKTLIYKWYLKYMKNPILFQSSKQNGQFHNINDSLNEPPNKMIKIENSSYSFVNMVNSQTPKRTRFSFKLEHLNILERSFSDNPYPDPKKREELARLCNSIRNGDLTEREKVTEQIVTHWFQNKRKLTRKMNAEEMNGDQNTLNTDDMNHFEINGDSTSVEYDIESPLNYQDDEIQMAAYKAIMSRMNRSPVRQDLNNNEEKTNDS